MLRRITLPTVLALLITFAIVPDAAAIPAFARRYKVSCALCHSPIPKLTAFGEQFAGNGFRFAPGEEPRDTINTGDPLLTLMRELPLAVRLDMYAQTYANGKAVTDFQTPYGLKLMSGAPISDKVSYYFYTFISERGEVGGIEDALIQVDDIAGQPVDVIIGQFQVSDPLFKRELRLEFEDYAVYRTRVGEAPTDLTYDRGVMVVADVAGFEVAGQLLNGNGIGAADEARRFDNNAAKNVSGRITRDLTDGLRVGAYGYTGTSGRDGVDNRTKYLGFDATLRSGAFELNGQYLRRTDSRATFTPGERETATEGGFAELLYIPTASRWYGFGLYNLVTADRPLLDARLGGPAGIDRHETISAGVGYLARRNMRWQFETGYDTEQELVRLTLGLVTAF
jgi:hypothetical protein